MKLADKLAIGVGALLLAGGGVYVWKKNADAQAAAAVAVAQSRPQAGPDLGQLIGNTIGGLQQAGTSISALWNQFHQTGTGLA